MTAISKSWVTIADTAVDPDSPVDSTLMFGLRDDLVHLREWLGASFTAGAVQNHNHDGTNSAKVQVGSNMVRNGDFEDGLTGWTATQYTGGTVAANASNADGAACVAITSTVLANGGGDVTTNEYMVVVGGLAYGWSANYFASAINISSKIEAIFYDSAKSQISSTTLVSSTNTPTTNTNLTGVVVVPANARYIKIKATGGVPSSGTATGTVSFDAIYLMFMNSFGRSLASSGFMRFPNGIIIQWGSASVAGVSTQVVTLPLTFPNAAFQAATTNSINGVHYVTSLTLTSITLGNGSGATGTVSYIAIGY